MLYLASRFVWFVLAAFAMGLVMGWLTRPGAGRPWSRALAVLALVWAAVAALAWSQTVNGALALWLETGLLFVAVYVLGWLLASLIRGSRAPYRAAVSEAPATPAAVADVAPVADAPAAALATVAALPKVEGEDDLPGARPPGLVAARDGKPDDLKLIKGVGKQNEGRLRGLGIWHFDQIAAWTPQNIEWVGGYLSFPGRIEREDWVSQAAQLAAGAETEFAKRARAGLVATSRDDGEPGEANVADLTQDGFDGDRPTNTLEAARDGKPDDLELIKGIGPAIAGRLNSLGIWHFDQIAELSEPELRYVSAFAGFPGRGVAEKWNEDADILRQGGETDHSRKIKTGREKAKD
jgi:predicted flap endonuclease-1-like 5' DNA nuclease